MGYTYCFLVCSISGFRPKRQLFGLSWDFRFSRKCRVGSVWFFFIRLLPRSAACKGWKVLIFVAFMKSFFAKHGENRTFLGQIVEILKCSPFIMFISHNCNQSTTQPKKMYFFNIHEIIICVQLQLQLQKWLWSQIWIFFVGVMLKLKLKLKSKSDSSNAENISSFVLGRSIMVLIAMCGV